jgi:aspartyl-tRNA(Asn)/glutamyl-tRNA(Gln) amidotransferase subunit A
MVADAAVVHARACAHGYDGYGDDVARRLATGAALPARLYLGALREQDCLRSSVQRVFADVDGVVGPTVGILPPSPAEAADTAASGRLLAETRLANLVDAAATSLPVSDDRAPVALQVTALDDRQAFAAARLVRAFLVSM